MTAHNLEEKVIGDIYNLLREVERPNSIKLDQHTLAQLSQRVHQLVQQVRGVQVFDRRQFDSGSASADNVAACELLVSVRSHLQLLLDNSDRLRNSCGSAELHTTCPWEGCEDIALEDLLEWFTHALGKPADSAGYSEHVFQQAERSQPAWRRQISDGRLPTFGVRKVASVQPEDGNILKGQLWSSIDNLPSGSRRAASPSANTSPTISHSKGFLGLKTKSWGVGTYRSFGVPSTVSNVSTMASLSSTANIRSVSESSDIQSENEARSRCRFQAGLGSNALQTVIPTSRPSIAFSCPRLINRADPASSIGRLFDLSTEDQQKAESGRHLIGVTQARSVDSHDSVTAVLNVNAKANQLPTFQLARQRSFERCINRIRDEQNSHAWEEEFLKKSQMF